METAELKETVEMLKRLRGESALMLLRTLRILLVCGDNDTDFGAVLVIRTSADDNTWMLQVQSMNLDLDDAYLALLKSAHQLGDYIKQEAPPSEYLN